MKFASLAALAWVFMTASAAPPPKDPKKVAEEKPADSNKARLPETLNMDTFDDFTSKQLTFVEFFSPYCSHCKTLAPKWEKAFHNTAEEQKQLGIHMRQVDCVKSGDLCEREGILFYPNLRLYVPETSAEGEAGKAKSKFVDSFPRSLARTPENFYKYMVNMAAEHSNGANSMPSSSEQIDIDLGMKIVAGEMEDPYFVTFYSANDDEWKSGKYSSSCLDCAEHRLKWDKLSNLVVSSTKTGHLNCLTHPILCQNLGYTELTKPDELHSPRYAMFVPKAAGLIRFDYLGDASVSSMKQFASKLSENSKYEEITPRDLEEYGYLHTELSAKPEDKFYPLTNKIALVFSYDKKLISAEDKAIMPYLLEMVTKSPFNINLFASKSNKYDDFIKEQANGHIQYVNSDPLFENMKFDNQMHLATTLTARPTLYIFKENSLIPAVYQNFALEDMRMPEKIQEFVNKHQFPIYGELTPELMKHYFSTKKNSKTDEAKVVVTFVDTTDANFLKDAFFNMSMVAHQYNLLKKEYYYHDLVEQREAKEERVAALKAQNAGTVKVIEGMRQKIPHLFDHNDVLFTYVDMEAYPTFAQEAGWDINKRGYKRGDSIVVTKSRSLYWDSTLAGDRLTNDPSVLRPVLQHLLNPGLVEGDASKFKSKLADSPYHPSLRMADNIHQHGFLGYLLLILLIFFVYIGTRQVLRSRRNRIHQRRGIIGEPKSD